jgi:hypothetical protein
MYFSFTLCHNEEFGFFYQSYQVRDFGPHHGKHKQKIYGATRRAERESHDPAERRSSHG